VASQQLTQDFTLEQLTVVTPVGYWRYDWVNYFLDECSTLAVYAGIAVNLRPIDTYIFSLVSVLHVMIAIV
jgi:hypothetical protein